MRVLRIIAWFTTVTLPTWIAFAVCMTYAGLAVAIMAWLMSYGAVMITMFIVMPIACVGFMCVFLGWGQAIQYNAKLRTWCDRQAERILPSTELPLSNNRG